MQQETPFKRHEPLYLKYRPQSLGQLVGQEGVKRTLVNAIENNRLTHAYLFTGPRGTGKTSSARILAKSLNCKSIGRPTTEPCQTCSCCIEITQGNSPAVFEIDAASNNSVDDARVLIERAPLVAVGGEYKIYIIDECHMLTKEAFNALLKTIEQPPPGVVFILATTEEHKVLPTIMSRCQRLMFKLINQEDLGRHLRFVADKEGIEIEEEALQLIARRSGGGLRDALSNLDQASLLAAPGAPATVTDLLRLLGALHEDVLLDLSKQIAGREGQSVIESVSRFLDEGREPQIVLQELARHFLSLMKASYLSAGTSATESDAATLASIVLGSESYIKGLLGQVSLFERAELSQIIEQLDRLEQTCRRSSQPAMHLEIGLLGICHRHDIHLLKDLLARVQHLEELSGAGAHFHAQPHAAQAQTPAQPGYQRQQPASVQREAYSAQSASPQPASSQAASSQAASSPAAPSHTVQSALHQPASQASQPGTQEAEAAPAGVPSRTQPDSQIRSIALAPDEATAAAGSAPQTSGGSAHPASAGSSQPGQASPVAARQPMSAAPKAPPAADSSEVSDESDSSADPRINELNSDIEYFWQQVLDELQRRHLPTYSLTSTHAFPLHIGAREVSIGVLKENFQKMLEGKAEHLKTACQAVTGMDLAIRIRVAADNGASKKNSVQRTPQSNPDSGWGASGPSAGAQNNAGRQALPESSAGPAGQAGTDPYPSESAADRSALPESYADTAGSGSLGGGLSRSTASASTGSGSGASTGPSSYSAADAPNSPGGAADPARVSATGEFDSTMVKEAYKLFEGPGSRRIN